MSLKLFCCTAAALCLSSPLAAQSLHEFTLKNGLTVVVLEDHRAPVVLTQVSYHVGSSDEVPGKTGLAHALEHMMFQGTPNVPAGIFAQKINAMGGNENAATTEDFTYFYEETAAIYLPQVFALEADRMQDLAPEQAQFEREMNVVKEERRMRIDDSPTGRLYEKFMDVALPASPYQHLAAGSMSDIEGFTLADIKAWHEKWYAPNNASLVVIGDVEPKKVQSLAEQYFGPIPAKSIERATLPAPVALAEREVTVKAPARLPTIMLGYNVPTLPNSTQKDDAYTLELISAILDGSNNARFAKDLVRGQALASDTGVSYPLYAKYPSVFIISASPAVAKSVTVLKEALLKEIKRLQTEKISPAELALVKKRVLSNEIYAQDSLDYEATRFSNGLSVGLSMADVENYTNALQKITPEQIMAVANTYFTPARLTFAKLDPLPLSKPEQATSSLKDLQHAH